MTIPSDSLILVTGVNGFLASHITHQFLTRGFRVRGTVRDISRSSWLFEGRFAPYAATGALEIVSVPDLAVPGAFDEAVKGVAAIVHTAYITNIVPDPNEVITPSVNGIRSLINSALKEASVKEFLFTSSAMAASPLSQDADNGTITRKSWNEAALTAAWAPPPYGISHLMANYPASKAAAEKEVWKLVEESVLPFNVNVVSPAGLIGEPLERRHIEGQANWVAHVWKGNRMVMAGMPASFYADVKDVALIHVAAILDPEMKNARLQSWGHSTHWNDILAIMRRFRPEKSFVEDYPSRYELKVEVDQSESVSLLRKWSDGKRVGWTGLEESVAENVNTEWLE